MDNIPTVHDSVKPRSDCVTSCPTCNESHPFTRFNIPPDGAVIDGIQVDVPVELSFCSPSCRSLWIVDYLLGGCATQIPASLMQTLLTPAVAA